MDNLFLDFDEDGDAEVFGVDRAGDNVTYMVEDLLPRQVYRSDGDFFTLDSSSPESSVHAPQN